ncbi:MAG: hypothetical protein ABSF83_08435 [Nitrososphaerales archaeon]
MVFEQVLTIIFALGVGVALVAYIARPRHRGASIAAGAARVGTFAPAGIAHAAPMPQAAAVEMPAVEASSSHPDVQQQSLTEVAPVVPDAAAAGPAQVAQVATVVVAADPPPAPSVPSTAAEAAPAPVAASAPRAPRKRTTRSTATKSHPRPARRTKKTAESSPADQPGA